MRVLSRISRNCAPALVVVLALLVAACAPAAPSPTAAPPPKPTEAPKAAPAPAKPTEAPAAKPAEKPAAKPTEAPAAKPAASPVAKPADKPAPKAVALPKPEVTSAKIAFAALEPNGFAAEFARDLGLYKKYGLDNVEVLFFEGSSRTLATITGGQVEGASTGVGSAFSGVKAGVPLRVVAVYVNKLTDDLVTIPSVKSGADLKGKNVAVSTFGGDSHLAVITALKGVGLTDKDVTIQQIGGQAARIAALKSGSVAAAPVDGTLRDDMKQQGFNILISLLDSPLQVAKNGLMLREDWMKKNPNAALAVVAANLEAMQVIYTDTGKAAASLARWQQLKDPSAAQKVMQQYVTFANRNLRWTKEGFEAVRDVQQTIEPEIAGLDVSTAYTFEFLDKLRELGFNDAVGVPRS